METGILLKTVRNLLNSVVNNIDAGNSNMTEEEAIAAIEALRKFSDKSERLSKYEACRYLRISRATFDNYVRAGKIPRGKKVAGFKELFWNKKELDSIKMLNK